MYEYAIWWVVLRWLFIGELSRFWKYPLRVALLNDIFLSHQEDSGNELIVDEHPFLGCIIYVYKSARRFKISVEDLGRELKTFGLSDEIIEIMCNVFEGVTFISPHL